MSAFKPGDRVIIVRPYQGWSPKAIERGPRFEGKTATVLGAIDAMPFILTGYQYYEIKVDTGRLCIASETCLRKIDPDQHRPADADFDWRHPKIGREEPA